MKIKLFSIAFFAFLLYNKAMIPITLLSMRPVISETLFWMEETNVNNQVYKVENPVYLSEEEIEKKYWDKQVLMTNIEMAPDFSKMDGGIVRYYAIDAKDELYKRMNYIKSWQNCGKQKGSMPSTVAV